MLSLEGRLPRLSPDEAAVTRLLHDSRLATLLDDGRAWRVAAASVAQLPPAPVYRVVAYTAAGALSALLCAPALASLALAAAPDTPPALRAPLAQAALAEAEAVASRLGLDGLRVEAVQLADRSAVDVPRPWFQLLNGSDPAAWFSWLQLPAAVLPDLRALPLPAPPGTLVLATRITLCERPVAAATLQRLQPGDVLLLLPAAADTAAQAVTLRWGAPGARALLAPARLEHHTLTMEGSPRMDTAETTEAEDLAPIADVELPVRFELDSVALPLAELQAMQPGFVIELPTPLQDAAVRLVACGQTVATAQLVAVGDRLGARVTRLLLQRSDDGTPR